MKIAGNYPTLKKLSGTIFHVSLEEVNHTDVVYKSDKKRVFSDAHKERERNMGNILTAISIFLILFATFLGFVTLINHIFPMTRKFIPEDWQHWFSFQRFSYSALVAALALFLGQR
jgi:hypothetical protein